MLSTQPLPQQKDKHKPLVSTKHYGKTFIAWLIVALLVGTAYTLLYYFVICKSCLICLLEDGGKPITTALGFAGVVIVVLNTHFVITRIRRTDTQIEHQKQQLQEANKQIEEARNRQLSKCR